MSLVDFSLLIKDESYLCTCTQIEREFCTAVLWILQYPGHLDTVDFPMFQSHALETRVSLNQRKSVSYKPELKAARPWQFVVAEPSFIETMVKSNHVVVGSGCSTAGFSVSINSTEPLLEKGIGFSNMKSPIVKWLEAQSIFCSRSTTCVMASITIATKDEIGSVVTSLI